MCPLTFLKLNQMQNFINTVFIRLYTRQTWVRKINICWWSSLVHCTTILEPWPPNHCFFFKQCRRKEGVACWQSSCCQMIKKKLKITCLNFLRIFYSLQARDLQAQWYIHIKFRLLTVKVQLYLTKWRSHMI